MKLSKQVCTRTQSGQLQALGVLQDSSFIWLPGSPDPVFAMIVKPAGFWTAAYNTAELGEMLPPGCESYFAEHLESWNWQIIDFDVTDGDQQDEDRGFRVVAQGDGEFETEAEARADCLLMLLNSKQIKVKDINQHIQSLDYA